MIGEYLNFGSRKLPSILQTEAAECGLACLAMIASYHGHRIDLNTLRRRHPVSLKGVTLRGLIQVATQLNLACRPLRFELEGLKQLRLPAIVHWDMNHFVVLKAITGRSLVIHDPACGVRSLPLAEASKHLTGVALEISPAEGFAPRNERARLPFRIFWNGLPGLGSPLTQVFVLSIILELLVIAAPFYMQITVDEVIARGDVDLMLALALGFGLLAAINVATGALRSHIVLVVQNAVHFQMGARLFHHLVRLPLDFFEKRHIGDVLSRFQSIEPIRNVLAEGLILAAIDGIMAVATLAMIFVYSPRLALVVLTALLLYVAVRLALYRRFRDLSEGGHPGRGAGELQLHREARGPSRASSCSTAKPTGGPVAEPARRHGERERPAGARPDPVQDDERRHLRRREHRDRLPGGDARLENAMTVGMVFAFMAYKMHFTGKASTLVEKRWSSACWTCTSSACPTSR
jgi:ATP-binding cassette subfamily B protein RaxB